VSLKQIIKRDQVVKNMIAAGECLTLPGEPLIYSFKYCVAKRRLPMQYFRNKKFMSLVRCWFPRYLKKNAPVVLLVCFYVTPFRDLDTKLTAEQIRSEKVPASMSWELVDITLSLMELMKHALLNSYRQIVKFDCMKFYSNNPRTVVQFLSWSNYVNVQDNNSLVTKAENLDTLRKTKSIQSKRKGNVSRKQVCEATPA
jgi:hypothetical protein